MNIAIITTWFPAGAGYVSRAYRKIFEMEHKVLIYARGGKNMQGDSIWDDDSVTWAPLNFYGDIKVNHFLKWLKHERIDIVFFNEQRFWEPVIQAKNAGFSIGAYIDYYTEETVPIFEIYDFIICNTKRHYSVFDWHPCCLFLPWGTDIDVYKPFAKSHQRLLTFIISLGWEGNYIGDRKGLQFAVEAFKNVSGKCVLKIYSQLELSDCRLEWQNLIKDDSRIHFIVGTYDPFPFHEGDIYVYPSRLDGIGLSLPEAISCGLASITTDNPPMNEFVIDNFNGRLVEVNRFISRPDGYYWPQGIVSVNSLAFIMNWYVLNPEKAFEHGCNARSFAENNLSWTENSKSLNLFLKSIDKLKSTKNIETSILFKSTKIDRKLYPSLFFRVLILSRDILIKFGFSLIMNFKFNKIK